MAVQHYILGGATHGSFPVVRPSGNGNQREPAARDMGSVDAICGHHQLVVYPSSILSSLPLQIVRRR